MQRVRTTSMWMILLLCQNSAFGLSPPATDGIWHPVTASLGGEALPASVTENIVLKITDNKYDVRVNNTPDQGVWSVDKSTVPWQMTIRGTLGPNQGKTIPAIVEYPTADTMRVCYDLSGQQFPPAFESAPGTLQYLVEYRKELPFGTVLMGTVIEIPDGDILQIRTAEDKTYRIRLHGIDAPEAQQPWGSAAVQAVARHVSGKSVRAVTAGEDRSGQVIAQVYYNSATVPVDEDIHLNRSLVAEGFAWHYVRFAPDDEALRAAEQEARQHHRGLWADDQPIPPWEWRKAQQPASGSR